MNIAAVLVLEDAGGTSLAAARALLGARLPRVPRLRHRLHRAPVGAGRPFWADDPAFDLDDHLDGVVLATESGPGDDAAPPALLQLAADLVCRHLPRDRPLWTARWVTGLGERAALVLVVHHAMADGLGGLAALAALADGGAEPASEDIPRAVPRNLDLVADTWRQRARRVRAAPRDLAGALHGIRELGAGLERPELAPATSLNRPTGPSRSLTTVSVPLDPVVALAHARRCTVNDVVLTAIVGAMAGILRGRGERPDELVVSVPVSSRRAAGVDELGNRTGVVPMRLPTAGPPGVRLARVATISRARRQGPPGASAGPMGVVFRGLARVGLFQPFIARQRLVNTFITNVRGPAAPLAIGGLRVSSIVPVAVNPGNVGVSFDVMSYAGQLGVTVVADPAVVPDQAELTTLLRDELGQLLRGPQDGVGS